MTRQLHFLLVIAFGYVPMNAARGQSASEYWLESFPDEIQARIENEHRGVWSNAPSKLGDYRFDYVVDRLRRWPVGSTVRVAFQGGETGLRRKIAETAIEWAKHGNIRFDFGYDATRRGYREWSDYDSAYGAEIRISFDERGYWSVVGTASVNPAIVGPGEASMNFGGFIADLPSTWSATVLHEFGHALGFHHEHQHPSKGCDSEFRWEDDSKYVQTRDKQGRFVADAQGRKPGIYTVLAGAPNFWPKSKADHNLRQLSSSHAYDVSQFDHQSIMKYSFPSSMFIRGSKSYCFTQRNHTLSTGDQSGMATAYPKASDDHQMLQSERRKMLELITTNSPLSSETFRFLDFVPGSE